MNFPRDFLRRRRALLTVPAFLFVFLAGSSPTFGPGVVAVPAALAQLGQSDIEERLTCQCGCGLTVATCDHLQCGFGIPAKQKIAKELAAGRTGEEILASYVEEFGEKILSSPVASGFNLLAWIAPYAALLIAGLMVVGVVRRSGRPDADDSATANDDASDNLSDADRNRLRRALEEIDE